MEKNLKENATLLKDEIEKELNAVSEFTRYFVLCLLGGYPSAAAFFLSKAQEDQLHAAKYAQLYERFTGEKPETMNKEGKPVAFDSKLILQLVENFIGMEQGGVDRIMAIKAQLLNTPGKLDVEVMLDNFAQEHGSEMFTGMKLKEKLQNFIDRDKDDHAIDELFEDIEDFNSVFDALKAKPMGS